MTTTTAIAAAPSHTIPRFGLSRADDRINGATTRTPIAASSDLVIAITPTATPSATTRSNDGFTTESGTRARSSSRPQHRRWFGNDLAFVQPDLRRNRDERRGDDSDTRAECRPSARPVIGIVAVPTTR